MKKLIMLFAVATFIYGCSGNDSKETHVHDDGTTHEAHEEGENHDNASSQEEFTVGDTTNAHGHDHSEGQDHKH